MHIHIVGAGVIGLTTAYYLKKKGHDVTLIDKEDGVAKGSSFANGGQLSYCFSDPLGKPNLISKFYKIASNRDPAIKFGFPNSFDSVKWLISFAKNCKRDAYKNNQLELAELSLASRSLLYDLQKYINFDFDHQKSSKMSLFEGEEEFSYEENLLHKKRLLGNDNVALTIDAAVLKEPCIQSLNRKYVGAIFSESDEVGDTYLFCTSLKNWLEDNGAKFLFNTEIKELVKRKKKLKGLKTNKGFIDSKKLVVCAGTLTGTIIKSPQSITSAKGYSITLPPGAVDFKMSLTLTDQKILFTKLGNNIRITGFADFFYNGLSSKKRLEELLSIARDIAPDLADYDSLRSNTWSGDRPCTPSSIPYIGPSDIEGAFINSGHGFYGWTLSFASGVKISNYF